jgi:hypothetical protein
MPAIKPGDTIQLAAQDLIAALRLKHSKAPINLEPNHTAALRELAAIFDTVTKVTDDDNEPAPRVKASALRVQPSTSHDATSPRVIAQQPQVHQRTTRRNTPMPTIHETVEEEEAAPQPKSKTTTRYERRCKERQARR